MTSVGNSRNNETEHRNGMSSSVITQHLMMPNIDKMVPIYSGSKKESFEDFISDFSRAATLLNWSENDKLIWFGLRLEGDAKQNWREICELEDEKYTFSVVVDKFKKLYGKKSNVVKSLFIERVVLEEGEEVNKLKFRIENAVRKYLKDEVNLNSEEGKKLFNKHALGQLLKAVPQNWSEKIFREEVGSFNKAIEILEREEAVAKRIQEFEAMKNSAAGERDYNFMLKQKDEKIAMLEENLNAMRIGKYGSNTDNFRGRNDNTRNNYVSNQELNPLRVMSVRNNINYDQMNSYEMYERVPAIKIHLVKDTQNFMLLDTGASISILSLSSFLSAKRLGLQYKHVSRKVRISTINGRALNYSGCVDINFKIESKNFSNTFFLTEKLDRNEAYQGILGADFFEKYNTIINLGQRKLNINGNIFKFYEGVDEPQEEEPGQVVRIANTVKLEPNTEMLVLIKGDINMNEIHAMKFQNKKFENQEIKFENRLVSRDRKPHLRIRNIGRSSITLNKRTVVGRVCLEKQEKDRSHEQASAENRKELRQNSETGMGKNIQEKDSVEEVREDESINLIKEGNNKVKSPRNRISIKESDQENSRNIRSVGKVKADTETINMIRDELVGENKIKEIKTDPKIIEAREKEFDIGDFKLDHLPEEMREKFKILLLKNKSIFSKTFETMGCTDKIKPKIHLRHERPIAQIPLPIPQKLKEKVKGELKKLENAGIIERTNSLYASPLVIVNKKDSDKIRIVCDFRLLNKIAESDSYPLPKIFEILNDLSGSKIFAKVDLHSAFHQVMLPEEQRELFAFVSEFGNFHYNRLAFGFKNSSNIFQRVMDNALQGLKEHKIFPYVDDVVIGAQNLDELYEKLKIVFERFRLNNLTISAEKCMIGVPELTFLGFKVGEKILAPTEENGQKILNFPIPDTVRKIKRFLGMANFYRSLIPKYAELAKPLTDLTRKGVKFKPSDKKFIEHFKKLRDAFFNPPFIRQPDFNKKFYINTDASKIGIGGILMQKDEKNKLHPIAYFSRALNDAESKYPPLKLELMAIHNSIIHFKHYVYGTSFGILSDHKPLENYKHRENPGNLITRWLLDLANYDFEFEYIEGDKNVLADYLSRDPGFEAENTDLINKENESVGAKEKINCLKLSEGKDDEIVEISADKLPRGSLRQRKQQIREIAEILNKQAGSERTSTNVSMNEKISVKTDSELRHKTSVNNNVNSDVCINVIRQEKVDDLLSEENIAREQDRDERISEIKNEIRRGTKLDQARLKNYYLDEERNLLLYLTKQQEDKEAYFNKRKIVLPKALQRIAIERAHRSHLGIQKTFNFIRKGLFWQGYYDDIKNYIQSCEVCARIKGYAKKREFGNVPVPTGPLEFISMDILGPITRSLNGNKYILTILDHFSRFLVCYPLKSMSAEETAEALLDYISKFGIPNIILTDNGPNFKAGLLKRIYEIYGVQPRYISFFNAKCNGKTERVNFSIKRAINAVLKNTRNWEPFLGVHTSLYNGQFHPATGFSPDYLMFGGDRNRLLNLTRDAPEKHNSIKTYVQYRVDEIKNNYEIAHENLLLAQEKQNIQQLAKVQKSSITIGQRVFLREGKTDFGRPKYSGPFTVVKKFNDQIFEIRDSENKNKVLKVNISRLFELVDRKEHLVGNPTGENPEEEIIKFTFDATENKKVPEVMIPITVYSSETFQKNRGVNENNSASDNEKNGINENDIEQSQVELRESSNADLNISDIKNKPKHGYFLRSTARKEND